MHVEANGANFRLELSGPEDAPAVVLHHPLATDLTCWDALTRALETTYRVLRFDARGHGQSEPTPAPYAFPELAEDVIALMDQVGIAKAHFLGLSMGGMVGQYLGADHAGRFRALTLASTTSAVPAAATDMWQARIRIARSSGMRGTVESALERWATQRALAADPGLRERLVAYMLATPVEGYCGWCEAIGNLNFTDRVSEIALPTQVVVGAEDPATPPASAQIIHKRISGATYVEVPGVSHMLHLEDPDAFAAAVVPFIDRHRDA